MQLQIILYKVLEASCYENIPKQNRLCFYCEMNKIETESDFYWFAYFTFISLENTSIFTSIIADGIRLQNFNH